MVLETFVGLLCWCVVLVPGTCGEGVIYHGAPVIVIDDGEGGDCCGCYQQQPVPPRRPPFDFTDFRDESRDSRDDDSYEQEASDVINDDNREDELR